MKLITAPDSIKDRYEFSIPVVFLAGGITNCPTWQDEVVEKLKDEDMLLLNPRRKNFPIDDPSAAREQVEWEFQAINSCDIFSMWFVNSASVQPICMYELGRNLAIAGLYNSWVPDIVTIGIEPGYLREQDVRIQVDLVNKKTAANIATTLDEHVENIKRIAEGYL